MKLRKLVSALVLSLMVGGLAYAQNVQEFRNKSNVFTGAIDASGVLGQGITVGDLTADALDNLGEIDGALCADGQVLKNSGGSSWLCASDDGLPAGVQTDIDNLSISTVSLQSQVDGNDTEIADLNASTASHSGDVSAHHTATVDTFVTNKDSHDHNGGDGATIAHTSLNTVGTSDHHAKTGVDALPASGDNTDAISSDWAFRMDAQVNTSTTSTQSQITDNDTEIADLNASTATHSGNASAHHTATVDTNANTVCAGTDVYLDGEGNCDTISLGAIQVQSFTSAGLIADTPALGEVAFNSTDNDLYTSTAASLGSWRNSRTGSGPAL